MTKCIIVGKGRVQTVPRTSRNTHSSTRRKTGRRPLIFIQILFCIALSMYNDTGCFIRDANKHTNANHCMRESARADARSNGEGEE